MAFARVYDIAALNGDCLFAYSFQPVRKNAVIGLRKLRAIENLVRWLTCPSVRGFFIFCGSERMYAIPFQLEPTTVPTLPEKPPKIPFLIVPIFFKI